MESIQAKKIISTYFKNKNKFPLKFSSCIFVNSLDIDIFLSFPKKGIKSFIQPGGSIKDQEIINVANELGLIMVFTHTRHFLH